jgi:hypothetical protein
MKFASTTAKARQEIREAFPLRLHPIPLSVGQSSRESELQLEVGSLESVSAMINEAMLPEESEHARKGRDALTMVEYKRAHSGQRETESPPGNHYHQALKN